MASGGWGVVEQMANHCSAVDAVDGVASSTDAVTCFEHADIETSAVQLVGDGEAGKAGSDDDDTSATHAVSLAQRERRSRSVAQAPTRRGQQRRDQRMQKADPEVGLRTWWRGPDLNQRPSGYEPDELPSCSTPR